MRYYPIWKQLLDIINENQIYHNKKQILAVLLIVAQHRGSSPGKQGFKLLLSTKATNGTIGGGIMEHNLILQANSKINNNDTSITIKTLVHSENANALRSGLICSGSQTVIIIPITYSMRYHIEQIVDNYFGMLGKITIDENGIRYTKINNKVVKRFSYSSKVYIEYIGLYIHNVVYIFGAGHVGAAVSRVLSLLDFYIIIIDPRDIKNDHAHNQIQTTFSDSIIQIKHSINKKELNPKNLYLVIVTSSIVSDYEVLFSIYKLLNNSKPKYIGQMGSKTKLKKLFEQLKNNGVSSDFIESINSPIGIEINSGTAEEIAIAIVAELIKYKNMVNSY